MDGSAEGRFSIRAIRGCLSGAVTAAVGILLMAPHTF
jgi:hypothetical protein